MFNILNKFKKQTAFTLSEVLITLLIVGLISSIVIPVIINNTQEAEFKTAFKKEYGVIEQAVKNVLNDNITMNNLCADYDSDCFGNLIRTYLSYNKYCNKSSSTGQCFHDYRNILNLNNQHIDSVTANNSPLNGNDNSGLILNDGTLISFYYRQSTPDIDLDCYLGATNGGDSVAGITIDVNGWKRPNKLGKDIFSIILHTNRITPAGKGCLPCNNSSSLYAGFGCAVKVLKGEDY